MPSSGCQVDQLRKDVAELALRLAALPADGLRDDTVLLDAIEQLATRLLKEVSAARMIRTRSVGETSGMWRAVTPLTRQ
jgi:hypothetical protein